MHSFCFICNFRSLFFCLFLRWDRDRQVHIDEHSFQYNIWKWGSQPLWANGGAAPTHVWTAGEQCQPQADCCTHCRVWRPDQQRTEVQVADGCDDGLLVKMTFILFLKRKKQFRNQRKPLKIHRGYTINLIDQCQPWITLPFFSYAETISDCKIESQLCPAAGILIGVEEREPGSEW